jgi:hypothetical protein
MPSFDIAEIRATSYPFDCYRLLHYVSDKSDTAFLSTKYSILLLEQSWIRPFYLDVIEQLSNTSR